MSWARPGSAGGALGRPWGPWGGGVMQSVCSRKPPYKIHEDLRDSSGKEKLSVAMVESTPRSWYFEWDRSETIFGNFSSRPTQIQRDQEKFRHEGGEHEGRAQGPLRPPLQFRYPHCVPILMPMVLDSSHNLRMIHEGRTIVTILISAGVDSSCSGALY